MLEGWTLFSMGLLLGLRHATDADHVLAVSTLVSREERLGRTTLLGLYWGIGHFVSLSVAGGLVFAYGVSLPVWGESFLEALVGGVLILLGGSVVWDFVQKQYHLHRHGHGETVHCHLHSHAHAATHNHPHPSRGQVRTLMVGMLHGLAGSAPLFLLIFSTVASAGAALVYLLAYGAGATVGMAAISLVLGVSFRLSNKKLQLNEGLRLAAGCGSLVLGFIIMVTAL